MSQSALQDKAAVLIESLPYIRQLAGKTIVVKYGGAAMADPTLRENFAEEIVLLKFVGLNPVVVHGGGPQIGELLKRLGIESRFHEGQRITDEATMEVVEMVLVGRVNKNIVQRINSKGGRAVGLSGKDGQLIGARKLSQLPGHEPDPISPVDLGLVGEVSHVNPEVIKMLETSRYIPVIAPIAHGEDGLTYNINADQAACAIAAALSAEKLILLTDVEGVKDEAGHLISTLSRSQAENLIARGAIKGGMVPKVRYALQALDGGVRKTHILDGRMKHAVLLEIFTSEGVGTEIIPV